MKKWVLILFLGWSAVGFAQQRYPVKDGDTVRITVSQHEMNRLSAEGKNRIMDAWVINGEFELKPDEGQGALFIQPKSSTPFSFFLQDDLGNTFTVIAEPKKIPSQTIIFQGKAPIVSATGVSRYKGDPHLQRIATLNKAMSNRKPLKGYNRYEHDAKRISLWPDTQLRLVMTYESSLYIGEIFELRNISTNTLEYREDDFMNFGNGVLAVALEHLTVPPEHRTFLFVTRSAEAEFYGSAAK